MKDENTEPKQGGNIEKYKAAVSTKNENLEEFTYTQWSSSATDMVLLNLLQEFEKLNKTANDGGKLPALLDNQTLRVGLSFRTHKKAQNICQIIFIKQGGNVMI